MLSTIQASVIAAVNQMVWLIAGFGVIDNQTAGKFVALSGTVISLGFLIVHAVEQHGAAKVAAAKAGVQRTPAPPTKGAA